MQEAFRSAVTNKSKTFGMDEELFSSYSRLINPAYPPFLRRLGIDRVAVKAEGACITDSCGRTYIDCISGYGLFNLGHNHPRVVEALKAQLNDKQLFTRPFITEVQVRLAEKLAEISPEGLSCSFVCNSGSEAIDSVIKLARLYKGKKEIITAENSFHGYTLGALSASGILAFKRPFEPLIGEIIHVPFGDSKTLENCVSSDTAAILLEPIQHEAGLSIPSHDYFRNVRRICNEHDIIFILDETKTGFGKTGCMFAIEHFGVTPDVLVIGKSMGGGLMPIGAMIAKEKYWKKFGLTFSMSASSFAGNALASRAALTTISVLQDEDLINDCRRKGTMFLKRLGQCTEKHSRVLKGVKGLGLLIGVETTTPQKASILAREMIRRNVLVAPAFGNSSALIFEPPLVISVEQINTVIDCFEDSLRDLTEDEVEKSHE